MWIGEQRSCGGAQLSRGPREEGSLGLGVEVQGKGGSYRSGSRHGGGASVAGWQQALLKSLALALEDGGDPPAYTEGQVNHNLKAERPIWS